jgi:hypothetical protein
LEAWWLSTISIESKNFAAIAENEVASTEPIEKLGTMMTPTARLPLMRRSSAVIRSLDQPDVPTSTLIPCATANSTTDCETAGSVTSTATSAPSMSESSPFESICEWSSNSVEVSTIRETSWPILPVAPTTATLVVIRQI